MSADVAPGELDAGALSSAKAARLADTVEPAVQPTFSARERAVVQYERVAAKLLYAAGGKPFTLAVTSSVAGEGVSSVSLGLAVALSASTTRGVALVDGNLHRPTLHTMLRLPASPGLRDVIAGNENFQWSRDAEELYGALRLDAMETSVPNLWFVPSGGRADHPAQITTCDGAKAALRALGNRFGFVVMDCPPVLSAVDAASLCRMADGTLLVVRAGLTPREDITRARELLEGVPLLGAVLNGV